ncbi:MAG: hypothetical protein AAFQ94_03845 [Bacteroidota bacterium]
MRIVTNIIITISFLSLLLISSCGEDVQLPNKILQGEIDGSEWEFAIGKALSNQAQRTYKVELFSFTGFTEDEGCLLFGGTSRHVSVIIPFDTSNNTQLNAINADMIFHIDGANAFTADNGFVEISFINNREIRGFISAGSGSNNSVEGFFSVLICN